MGRSFRRSFLFFSFFVSSYTASPSSSPVHCVVTSRPMARSRRLVKLRHKRRRAAAKAETTPSSATPLPHGDASEADRGPLFEAYYRAMGIIADDADSDRFLRTLRRPLPLTFRLNGATADPALLHKCQSKCDDCSIKEERKTKKRERKTY